jgi:hypothetical protein
MCRTPQAAAASQRRAAAGTRTPHTHSTQHTQHTTNKQQASHTHYYNITSNGPPRSVRLYSCTVLLGCSDLFGKVSCFGPGWLFYTQNSLRNPNPGSEAGRVQLNGVTQNPNSYNFAILDD